jgi:AcrR family transcriptional regulator
VPRVSQEHLDARRREILVAAQRCFSRDGFHRTSMQDVFREAGLSAGAVYRYFPAKADIVAAIADESIARVVPAIERALAADEVPPLPTVVEEVVDSIASLARREDSVVRISMSVWAEALRGRVALLVARMQDAGRLPADSDPEEVARVVFALFPGFIVQLMLLGDVEPASFARGLSALLGAQVTAAR